MAIHHLVLLQIILILWPIKASGDLCPGKCGNVSIWYPFGIGEGCYYDKGFNVTCHNSSGKAFLSSINLELYTEEGFSSFLWLSARVSFPQNERASAGHNLSGSPFSFSGTANMKAGRGCQKYANISHNNSTTGACHSFCTCDPTQHQGCCDFLCPLSPNQTLDISNMEDISSDETIPQECRPTFIVDKYWLGSKYLTDPSVLKDKKHIPVSLEWGKSKGRCVELFNQGRKSCNMDNFCLIQLNSSYICLCDDQTSEGDLGCAGELICNTTGGYNCSGCPPGYNSSPQRDQHSQCSSSRSFNEILKKKKRRVKFFIIIGCSSGLGMLLLLLGAWWLYKFIERRKAIRQKQKFFERNGGLLLEQHLSSNRENIEKIKVFTSKELEKATDNYNANRVLGQGGQGIVYKGMLTDGRIVAVKRSKMVDMSQVEEFINEVVILSRINHRNVVQLLGCCLETEVPLLVYEFIPNGTLFHHIHDQNDEFPITWELRLRIAIEIASVLSYLHSSASIPIYHRDIKSTNILLDEKYRAKVSDFGTSRFVTVDQTHLTTQVQGTFGYIDPEYFQSSKFTEKSDVYSFGVVLVELLTGQKPIRTILYHEEDISLVVYFLHAMEENRLLEILDARVLKEGEEEEIMMVANLTKRCLNLNGKRRPTMREVATELAGVIE